MRTINLTHEQIELICQALGIAENQFSNIHKTIIEKTVNVRNHSVTKQEQTSIASLYNDIAFKLAYLNIDIQSGKFDV